MTKTIEIKSKAQLMKVKKMFSEMLDGAYIINHEDGTDYVHDACNLVIKMIDAIDEFENLRSNDEVAVISFPEYHKHQSAAFAYGFQANYGVYENFSIKTTLGLNSLTFSYKNLKAFASYILAELTEKNCTRSFARKYNELFVEVAEAEIEDYIVTAEAQEVAIQSEEDFAGIIRFEVGKVYKSIESKGEYRVVERKSTEYGDTQLTVEEADGRMYHTAFIHVVDGVETVKNLYYRCEVLKADDVVEQPTPQVGEPVEKVILDKIACTIAYSEKIGNRRAINSIYNFVKEAETKGLIDLAREVKFKTIAACWSDSLDNFYIEDYLKMLA